MNIGLLQVDGDSDFLKIMFLQLAGLPINFRISMYFKEHGKVNYKIISYNKILCCGIWVERHTSVCQT